MCDKKGPGRPSDQHGGVFTENMAEVEPSEIADFTVRIGQANLRNSSLRLPKVSTPNAAVCVRLVRLSDETCEPLAQHKKPAGFLTFLAALPSS